MHITHVPSSQLGGEGIMRLHHWSASLCSGESARGRYERSVLSAEVESFSTYHQ